MKNNFIFKIINEDLIKNNNLKVKTRFSPEPNGYLHIGHIKSIYLNYFISKKYNGKFNLRIDDTNPYTSKKKYVNNIIKDIKWLNINYDELKYTSDYFDTIYNFAIYLINKKLAYIDSFDRELIKKNRGNFYIKGINSYYRNRSIEENIFLFDRMKNGYYKKENFICLRLKINMKSNFIILRDPIIYRIKLYKHYKTNYDWCIYPTYDFSHCISDYLENISHSLCTLEFLENKLIYNWILNNLNIDKNNIPKQYEFSKFNIEYNLLSKRKINRLIEYKKIKNLSDKRLLNISSIKKRGYYSKSIINILNNMYINKNESILKTYEFNNYIKKDIEKSSLRLICILNPIKIIIINLNKKIYINVPNNPYYKEFGNRKFLFDKIIYIDYIDFNKYFYNFKKKKLFLDNFIKLKYSYIIKPFKILFKKNNIFLLCKYFKNSINKIYIFKKRVNCIINWLSYNNTKLAKINIYNNLFYLDKIHKVSNYINKFNKNSIYTIKSYIENNNNIKNNKIYQLEKIGFFNIKIKKNILLLDLILKIKNNNYI